MTNNNNGRASGIFVRAPKIAERSRYLYEVRGTYIARCWYDGYLLAVRGARYDCLLLLLLLYVPLIRDRLYPYPSSVAGINIGVFRYGWDYLLILNVWVNVICQHQ